LRFASQKYCSQRCSRRAHASRRDARKRGQFVADVSPEQIYQRDQWRCQLCGTKLNRKATVPHPHAPTIDHIIPLATGGTHEPANVQAAHFICNVLKADRGGGEQLALVG
jgi:5-methylcytosine-specific restriction endonuclease McrA